MKLSFLVPNEEDTRDGHQGADRVPDAARHAIPGVAVGQKPGWSSTVTTKQLAKPITDRRRNHQRGRQRDQLDRHHTGRGGEAGRVRRVHHRRRRPARRRRPSRVQGGADLLRRHSRALDRPGHRRAAPRPSTRRRSSSSPRPRRDARHADHARCRPAAPTRSSRPRPRTTAHARSGSSASRSALSRWSSRPARSMRTAALELSSTQACKQHLGHLHAVQRRALAQVVAGDPEVERARLRRVLAHAPDEHGVDARRASSGVG